MSIPHFRIPLNLPHAATISRRIERALQRPEAAAALEIATMMVDLLQPCLGEDDNPPTLEASLLCVEAARLGRLLVDEIESANLGGDRLGQCVRNFFECLELGEEGALLSLRAGESPDSLQRPI